MRALHRTHDNDHPLGAHQMIEPEIPPYRWESVPDPRPENYGATSGCYGCDFKPLSTGIRCSRIPCQTRPNQVAKIIGKTPTK